MEESIVRQYGNRVRVRVCGFLKEDDKLLLIKHINLGTPEFWVPPGGGMEFGESAIDTLMREFREETGLEIRVKKFLCINEFLQAPLHGIELFFEVERVSGELVLGSDPEMKPHEQILQELCFLSIDEIREITEEHLHPVLKSLKQNWKLDSLSGFSLNGSLF